MINPNTVSEARVISVIRPLRPIYRESSLSAAIEALRESESAEAVAVLDGSFVVGVVWASEIRRAALSGTSLEVPISNFMDAGPPRLLPNASLEEARAVLTASGAPALIVADIDGRYLGMLSALDLYHRGDVVTRPPLIGGMATPFGVFLTNGEVSGGAGPAALMATGGILHILLMAGIFVTFTVIDAVSPRLLSAFGPHGIAQVEGIALAVLPAIFFFTLLRLLPLSGTHGAEHMVVHAIERREPLTYEVVRRMPRVHPRCGTNLAVGAMLFMWLIGLTWDNYREIGALFALVMTVLLWRPLGGVFQKYVTTKTPTRQQLEGAIAAGQELLGKYILSVRAAPSFARRILMSGLPWVLSGWFITFVVVYLLVRVLHLDPGYLGLG